MPQKQLYNARITEKLSKGKHKQDFTTKQLKLCKTWRGLCTTVKELTDVLKNHQDIEEKIVITEFKY